MIHSSRPTRQKRVSLLGVVALALAAIVGAPAVAATDAPVAPTTYTTDAPMILQNVPLQDITSNRGGICHSPFTMVIANFSTVSYGRRFLDAAQACGLKVIVYFSTTVRATTGTVYPSRVGGLVKALRDHPALWGYLTVKEPSWSRINAREIRSLYAAFKAADPNHPVMALFGDTPHFATSVNPYTAGMADVVMVDWYPVETSAHGSSNRGTSYVATGPANFKRIRAYVAAKTPGTPIWLMVATHKNLARASHKKQRPTQALLARQVREGFTYLGASGIAFQTWANPNYTLDERRDATMVGWMLLLGGQVRAGTFH